MKIPLFDLDWTLIAKDKKNIHRESFHYAFKKVFGLTNVKKEIIEGRVDNQIIVESLTPYGISVEEIKRKIPEATNIMSNYVIARRKEGVYNLLPGVTELLLSLKENGASIGLLTGNVERIAWTKLEEAGINKYFDFGAFGDEAFKRIDLVELARRKAQLTLGRAIEINDFVIIGDSTKDVECARDASIRVISVATGPHSFEQLKNEKPDLLIRNFKDEGQKVIDFLNH